MSASGATKGKGHTHQSRQENKKRLDIETVYIPPGVVETFSGGKRVINSVGRISKVNGCNFNITKIKDGQTVLGSCNWTRGRNKERLEIGNYVLIQEDERIRMMNGVPIVMKYSDGDILQLEKDGHLKQQSVQSKVVSIQDDKQADLTLDELKDLL